MFERFTRQARAAVLDAQRYSRELRHPYIGTEHLLLALLDDDGGAGTVLRGAGLTGPRVRDDIVRHVGSPDDRLAALDEEDAAALRAIGIDLDAVRAKVEDIFGPGSLQPPPAPAGRRRGGRARLGGHPFSRRAKKVLELSLREAIALRHSFIGTEHLLLGLVREGDGLAARILVDNGIDLADLRARTVAALRRAA